MESLHKHAVQLTCKILVVIIQSCMHQRNVFGLAGVQHVAKAARAGGVAVGEWQTGVGVAYDTMKWTLLQGRVLFDVKVAALFTEGGVRDLPEQVFVRDCRKSKYQNKWAQLTWKSKWAVWNKMPRTKLYTERVCLRFISHLSS